jgi:hypothetical protein
MVVQYVRNVLEPDCAFSVVGNNESVVLHSGSYLK